MATKKQQPIDKKMEQQAQMPPAPPTTDNATREQLVAEIHRLRAVIEAGRKSATAMSAAFDRSLG